MLIFDLILKIVTAIAAGAACLLLSSCEDDVIYDASTGGNNYIVSEAGVRTDAIAESFDVSYDEATDIAEFTVSFFLPSEFVPGLNDPKSVALLNADSVTVDSQVMEYEEGSEYIADDSVSDTVSCNYKLKIQHPDLNHAYLFEWTSKDGRHFANSVQIPTPVHLPTAPTSIASGVSAINLPFSGGPLSANEELNLDVVACEGSYPSQSQVNQANSTVNLDLTPFPRPCVMEVTLWNQFSTAPTEAPSAGGSLSAEFYAAPIEIELR